MAHLHNGIFVNFPGSSAPAQGKGLCQRSHARKIIIWMRYMSAQGLQAQFSVTTTAPKISIIISVVNDTVSQTHSQNHTRKMPY